eukprot:TRINITY_DN74168_c0_g1_i1.p1 TRINITY_DN74168_c0_g1~~TRINITY_DN74168_c0_g1_i1.p1  ORF type:complete len:122 (-),score=26.85 TRINITY_DN74168_c0_g1_i1:246-557(-)
MKAVLVGALLSLICAFLHGCTGCGDADEIIEQYDKCSEDFSEDFEGSMNIWDFEGMCKSIDDLKACVDAVDIQSCTDETEQEVVDAKLDLYSAMKESKDQLGC